MSLKIEKGIAMPMRNTYSEISSLALRMSVGDSVKVRKSQAVAMSQAIRRHGGLASMRKIDDDTWRVWKVK